MPFSCCSGVAVMTEASLQHLTSGILSHFKTRQSTAQVLWAWVSPAKSWAQSRSSNSMLWLHCTPRASLVAQMVKNLSAMQETQVQSLDGEDPLEKRMATHSSILAWGIPWTEEPGRLQSMGWQRSGHNWVINTFTLSYYTPKKSILWFGLG